MKTKIGLIGFGRIGRMHVNNLLNLIPDVELTGVADTRFPEKKFREEFPDIFFTSEIEALLSKKEIEGVVVCTPTNTHREIVEMAVRFGKDIFCEKPLDFSLSTTEMLFDMAQNAGLNLMVGFNRRFDPGISNLKAAVHSGAIGTPTIIKITNRDPDLPSRDFIPSSGGLFMDFTIHDFDTVRFLSGRNVEEIYALGSCFIDKSIADLGDIDTALVNITLDDGCFVVIDNSRQAVFGYDQRIEVFGRKGMLRLQNELSNQNKVYNKNGIHYALPFHSFKERYKNSYLCELQKFVRIIKREEKLTNERNDVLKAMKIVYAARKSFTEKRIVKLSEMRNDF